MATCSASLSRTLQQSAAQRRLPQQRHSAACSPLPHVQQHRCLPRRPAAAAPVAISAAQKKVFKSFQDMIMQTPEPALVEFFATWCGPCYMMGQILDEVAPALRNRVRFFKVDTEKYPTVANQYNIRALPTLIYFENGQPVDRVEGVLSPADLRTRLEQLLAKHAK